MPWVGLMHVHGYKRLLTKKCPPPQLQHACSSCYCCAAIFFQRQSTQPGLQAAGLISAIIGECTQDDDPCSKVRWKACTGQAEHLNPLQSSLLLLEGPLPTPLFEE
eukprot:1139047-Pelagomonas_calceolata.AAC.2